MNKLQFQKQLRLLKPAEFRRVLDARHSASDRFLRIGGAANGLSHPRLGLTVSRKVGNAVVRNRWKRTLREAFRLTQRELPPLDLVCVPRSDRCPGLEQLVVALPALASRLEKQLARDHASGNVSSVHPSKEAP